MRLKELVFLRVIEEAILSKAFKDAPYMRDVGVATARVDNNIIQVDNADIIYQLAQGLVDI